MDYFQKALARQQLGEFYFCQNQMTVLYAPTTHAVQTYGRKTVCC